MNATLLTILLVAGQTLAADLPAPFHHVRLASLELAPTAAPASLKDIQKGWFNGIPCSSLDGPTAVGIGASRKLSRHFEASWTATRFGIEDRSAYSPVQTAQHWTSAIKIKFHF